jgi:hypothetical protein
MESRSRERRCAIFRANSSANFPPGAPLYLTCVDESFRHRAHKPDTPVLTRPNLPSARTPGPIAAPMSTRLLISDPAMLCRVPIFPVFLSKIKI